MGFELHPQLTKDTIPVCQLQLCWVLLMNESQFPWLILVPMREGVREIFELSTQDQQQLIFESSAVGRVLKRLFHAEKLNIAAIGNKVSQLHLHHIARFQKDPLWPDPVWGKLTAVPYEENMKTELLSQLRAALSQEKIEVIA